MDWPFQTAEYVELADEVLRLRVEVETLRAEVETLRARIAELEPPRAKKKRGRPRKAEVGAKYWKKLAAKGKVSTAVNLGTGAVQPSPRAHGTAPTPQPDQPEAEPVVTVTGEDLNIREGK